jgi:hypothetical protein
MPFQTTTERRRDLCPAISFSFFTTQKASSLSSGPNPLPLSRAGFRDPSLSRAFTHLPSASLLHGAAASRDRMPGARPERRIAPWRRGANAALRP